MGNDLIYILTGFRKTAFQLFEKLYHDFIERAKQLDRQADENVFQQLRCKYECQLQQQLGIEAKELLRTYKRDDLLQLHQSLARYINYCLSEFRIKANSF